jgi:hypothetical protein
LAFGVLGAQGAVRTSVTLISHGAAEWIEERTLEKYPHLAVNDGDLLCLSNLSKELFMRHKMFGQPTRLKVSELSTR